MNNKQKILVDTVASENVCEDLYDLVINGELIAHVDQMILKWLLLRGFWSIFSFLINNNFTTSRSNTTND